MIGGVFIPHRRTSTIKRSFLNHHKSIVMKRQLEQVKEFNEELGVSINEYFDYMKPEEFETHRKLILEELRETELAQKTAAGRSEVLDGIVDTLYLVFGMAVRYGIKPALLEAAFDEVHQTNMAKRGGPVREDGKILKPKGWKPPNLKLVIELYAGTDKDMTLALEWWWSVLHSDQRQEFMDKHLPTVEDSVFTDEMAYYIHSKEQ
jgi:predicted HAD superfamily Cof-like phosphohydrolase